MPELLVVRLHPLATVPAATSQAPRQIQWLVVDTSNTRTQQPAWGTLREAVTHTAGRKVIVVVPGTDVLLTHPVLPVKNPAKAAQIVPFALEEQLASDVEDLHFALGKRPARIGTPVAVVAHERMREWLQELDDAGLQPEAIHADTALLPETPGGITVLIDQDRVYVRREDGPGAVVEVTPLSEALQLALANSTQERENVTVYVGAEDYQRDRELLEGLRERTASLQIKRLDHDPLLLLAGTLSTQPVNLLQGRYARKTRLNISFAPWRYAAMLALVLMGAHLGLQAWQYASHGKQEAILDEQILAAFQQAMPGAAAPQPDQARALVERVLNQGSGAFSADSGMLDALAMLGAAMRQLPGTDIEALSYRNNVTDLRVLAPSVDMLETLRQRAGEHGIDAQIQSANPRNSKFEGRMQFRKTGA